MLPSQSISFCYPCWDIPDEMWWTQSWRGIGWGGMGSPFHALWNLWSQPAALGSPSCHLTATKTRHALSSFLSASILKAGHTVCVVRDLYVHIWTTWSSPLLWYPQRPLTALHACSKTSCFLVCLSVLVGVLWEFTLNTLSLLLKTWCLDDGFLQCSLRWAQSLMLILVSSNSWAPNKALWANVDH